ncbi:hypothetical protein HYS93_00935 [Candidatus Daviesbacteria bacterium]|nr:hypothetical protein [Candidatus Daviesbacteria bacterium]
MPLELINLRKKSLLFLISLLAYFNLYKHVSADEGLLQGCIDNQGIATLKCIPVFLNNINGFILGFSAVVTVFFITFSGIKFLTSGGDQDRVRDARKTMTFAIVGLVIILLAFFLIKIVAKIANIDCTILGLTGC